MWFEEFIDGGVAPHVLHGLLMQRVFARRFLNRAPDEALIRRSLEVELPPRFAYLERAIAGDHVVGDTFGIADIALISILINYHFAGERLGGEYPRLSRYLAASLQRPSVRRALALELPAAGQIEGLDLTLVREAS